MLNNKGRVTQPPTQETFQDITTVSGHRGLSWEEPLIFENGGLDQSVVDLPEVPETASKLGDLARSGTTAWHWAHFSKARLWPRAASPYSAARASVDSMLDRSIASISMLRRPSAQKLSLPDRVV